MTFRLQAHVCLHQDMELLKTHTSSFLLHALKYAKHYTNISFHPRDICYEGGLLCIIVFISVIMIVMSPLSFLILVIWVLSVFLVDQAKVLILLTFLKNQRLFLIFFSFFYSIFSILYFSFWENKAEAHYKQLLVSESRLQPRMSAFKS